MTWRAATRRPIPFLVAATGGFLLAYVIVALFVFPANLVATDVRVPNVTGLPYPDATALLAKAGLGTTRGEQRYDNSAPAGAVLAQNPLPDAMQPKGGSVVLDVSRGQRLVDVPRLVGLTRQQAQQTLENAGLDVGDVTPVDNEAPLGQVLSSTPAAGARVPVPSPVSFTVSDGPPAVSIPDVTGQDYTAARALLAQLGFAVGAVSYDTTSMLPTRAVVAQTPAAGSPAHAGDTITLTLAGRP
ncbi:MAG TPA: PASTA domain-containing protein [Gemmatimonadaceae bacterium]|jgi:serine/threonine-protein kinase